MSKEKLNVKCAHWLLDELPELKAQSVIDETAANRLERYYREQLSSQPDQRWKRLSIVTGILGALFACAGLALIVAHNWDELPAAARLAMGFLPFAAGIPLGIYTLLRDRGIAWQESSAILMGMGIASSIAVVSQVYQLGGELPAFMRIWMILMIPLIVLFRSFTVQMFYSIAFFVMIVNLQGIDDVYILWLLPVAGYAVWEMWKHPESIRAALYRYASIPIIYSLILILEDQGDHLQGIMTLPISVLIAGALTVYGTTMKGNVPWGKNPYPVCGFLSLAVLALIFSYPDNWYHYSSCFLPGWSRAVCSILGAGAGIWLIAGAIMKRQWSRLLPVAMAGLLFPGVYLFFGNNLLPNLIMTALTLGSGIWLLLLSVRCRSMAAMNGGMVLILALALEWFCASDLPILITGLSFIVMGLLFGGANIGFGIYLKKIVREEVK